jgi:hypothetical protein
VKRTAWILTLVPALLALADVRMAQAVPAFARREGAKCQMCHFRLPELNEDGHAYLRRGLREAPEGMKMAMPGGQEMAMPTKTPAAATSRPLGEPVPLQWSDYLTVMGHHMFIAQRGKRPDFDAGAIDIWAAGPFNPHWSALANPSFDIEEGGSDVDQAYGEFITHWGERFQSVRFGQAAPFAVLFNGADPSMTLTAPVALTTPADTGNSWTPATRIRGVEVGAIDLPRWNAYVGVGQPHLEDEGDREKHTDFYASAERLVGERGNSLTAYGYWGEASLAPGDSGGHFRRAGLFANVYGPHTKGIAGYLTGRDRAADGRELDNSGYFLLAEQLLSERWAAYGRYDHLKRDLAAGGSETIEGPTLGISWWAQTQTRLTLETQFLKTTGERRQRVLMAEWLWAF